MGKGKWIWFPGDYEIYHSLLVHSRRYERGVHIPCQWHLATPYPNVTFSKEIELTEPAEFVCRATAPGVVTVMTGDFPHGSRVAAATLPAMPTSSRCSTASARKRTRASPGTPC